MKLDLRWNRILIAAIAMAGLAAAPLVVRLAANKVSTLREQVEAQLHPRAASDSEEIGILHGVLKDEFFTSYGYASPPDGLPPSPEWFTASDPIVLVGSTPRTCESLRANAGQEVGCISAQDRENESLFIQDQKIPARLLQELFAANQHSSPLLDPHDPAILYCSAAVFGNLAQSPDLSSRFHASFPHAKYAIEISRAVLSRDGTHALIHVQFWFLPNVHKNALYYLANTHGAWRVEIASGPEIY